MLQDLGSKSTECISSAQKAEAKGSRIPQQDKVCKQNQGAH